MTLLIAASASAQSLVPGAAPARTPAPTPPVQVAPQPPVPPVPPRVPSKLKVGDPAPKLEAMNWLAGEPVKAFAPGTTYVVEFWAPWCPWCREALPLYADMAKLYADRGVQVVGVAVWPKRSSPELAREFVEESAESFTYPVAEDVGDKVAKAWLDAADVLIPTAFVVDGTGHIAWIGDPRQGLDKVLTKQVGGEAADSAYSTVWRQRMAYTGDIAEAAGARKRGDWKAAAEKSKANYEKDNTAMADEAVYYYISLVMLGEKEKARAWGERLLSVDFAAKFNGLNSLAWYVVDPKGSIPKDQIDLDLALRAAMRADDLSEHKNPYVLDTLARVQFMRGQLAEALRLQLRAVERAARLKGDPMGEMLRKDLSERLDQYEQAADMAADKADAGDRRP